MCDLACIFVWTPSPSLRKIISIFNHPHSSTFAVFTLSYFIHIPDSQRILPHFFILVLNIESFCDFLPELSFLHALSLFVLFPPIHHLLSLPAPFPVSYQGPSRVFHGVVWSCKRVSGPASPPLILTGRHLESPFFLHQ